MTFKKKDIFHLRSCFFCVPLLDNFFFFARTFFFFSQKCARVYSSVLDSFTSSFSVRWISPGAFVKRAWSPRETVHKGQRENAEWAQIKVRSINGTSPGSTFISIFLEWEDKDSMGQSHGTDEVDVYQRAARLPRSDGSSGRARKWGKPSSRFLVFHR